MFAKDYLEEKKLYLFFFAIDIDLFMVNSWQGCLTGIKIVG